MKDKLKPSSTNAPHTKDDACDASNPRQDKPVFTPSSDGWAITADEVRIALKEAELRLVRAPVEVRPISKRAQSWLTAQLIIKLAFSEIAASPKGREPRFLAQSFVLSLALRGDAHEEAEGDLKEEALTRIRPRFGIVPTHIWMAWHVCGIALRSMLEFLKNTAGGRVLDAAIKRIGGA